MKDFNKKWWFRLMIVFYVLLIIFGFGILTVNIVDSAPSFSAYASTFTIKCDDGYFTNGDFKYGKNESIISDNIYSVKKNSHFVFTKLSFNKITRALCADIGGVRNILKNGNIDEKNAFLNKIENGEIDELIPIDDNFKILVKDANYWGSWKDTILWGFLSIIGFIVFLFVIRYIFFYILTGKHKLIFNEIKK